MQKKKKKKKKEKKRKKKKKLQDGKAVSPRDENFTPPVGKWDEISLRVAGIKILPCNRKCESSWKLPLRGMTQGRNSPYNQPLKQEIIKALSCLNIIPLF